MNSKHKKYKEFLRLQREIQQLENYYDSIIVNEIGPNIGYRGKIRKYNVSNPLDYTEVKSEYKKKTNDVRRWRSPDINFKWVYDKPTQDLINIDVINKLHGFWEDDRYKHTSLIENNNIITQSLYGAMIEESYYKKLPKHLRNYFNVFEVKTSEKDGTYSLIWKEAWHWKVNKDNVSERVFDFTWVKEPNYRIVYNKVYYFNRDIRIHKEFFNNVVYQRFDIFSDIKKQYDYLDYKCSQLGQYCGFYGRIFPKGWKKWSHKKSRSILKQNLREAVRDDYYDNVDLDYHNPHCDRWIWD